MSFNLAASQTRRLSVSASGNLRLGRAHLIDLKWQIQVTLLHKRLLKASLGWFLFADVRTHSTSAPSDLIRTGRYLETQSAWKSQREPWSVGTERKWRLQRGEAIILPATGSFNLNAYRKSLIGRSRLSAQTQTAPRHWRSPGFCLLWRTALPLIRFGSSLLFPSLEALGLTSLPALTLLAAGVTRDYIKLGHMLHSDTGKSAPKKAWVILSHWQEGGGALYFVYYIRKVRWSVMWEEVNSSCLNGLTQGSSNEISKKFQKCL